MKKFRKLIPALCMLLVSALFVGTSTYAWFSMNTSVSATNMQVTAKSDNIYLQISQSGQNAYDKTATSTEDTSKVIYPVDYKTLAAGTVTWGNAASDNPAKVKYTERVDLNAITGDDEIAKYVLTQKFDIKVADAQATAANLILSEVNVTGNSIMKEALRVVVVSNTGAVVWANDGAKENGVALPGAGKVTVADGNLAATVSNTPTTVTVYVYFSGNDDTCYTNNIKQAFENMKVDLTFTASAPSQTAN